MSKMLLKFVLFSTIFGAALAGPCYDNGDKQIEGLCFKFVPQKLTYEDARDWCHYQNPVTSSYLAYVPDLYTCNFLASYARTSFGTDSNFWIGLSRNTSSSWIWDNGRPLTFTNWDFITAENFATESTTNAKWNPKVDSEKNYFVCSYDPQAPPTFAPPVTTPSGAGTTTRPVPTTTDEECTHRTSSSTILFAYSNDIDTPNFDFIVDDLFIDMKDDYVYTKFANVRFDVQIEEAIQYHSDVQSFNQSIYDRMPDLTLGYKDNRGSNVLSVLQKFLDNDQVPLCGSLVHVLVGRYPDETDASYLINRLREKHVFVYFSAMATPSAGSNPKILCDVASSTNGFCGFGDDSHLLEILLDGNDVLMWPYQFVAQNYVVSGSGRIEVPVFRTPIPYTDHSDTVLVVITLQDHPPVQEVSLNFTIVGPNDRYDFNGPIQPGTNGGQYGTECAIACYLKGYVDYKWTIDYRYPNNEPQRIQARMYSKYYHDFLPLPPI